MSKISFTATDAELIAINHIWEENISSPEASWASLYEFLNYPQLSDNLASNFARKIIHPEDKKHFFKCLENFTTNKEGFKYKVRLKNTNGIYHLYEIKGRSELNELLEPSYDLFLTLKRTVQDKMSTEDLKELDFFHKETASMTNVGGWSVDLKSQAVFWDEQAKKIYGVDENLSPQFDEVLTYYAPEYQDILSDAITKCLKDGIHYDMELQIITQGQKRWVRTKGKPVYNSNKEIVKARGIIQDIDDVKNKELKLMASFETIVSQNDRLYNFAHIVSHNLRSHTGNLELIVSLLNDPETSKKEQAEYLQNLNLVSSSLNETIAHLNEVVAIQLNEKKLVEVNIEDSFHTVQNSMSKIIESNHAQLTTNFQVKSIQYIAAYMDSILLNLLTNAIKFRQPDKLLKIKVSTFLENNKTVLTFSDNGIGIDLKKNEDKLFGMYKTFHNNDDSRGIGLFMTKNQIESLNGKIEVSSTLNEGSTFKIIF
jgi:PAS domain S-box-containing protein